MWFQRLGCRGELSHIIHKTLQQKMYNIVSWERAAASRPVPLEPPMSYTCIYYNFNFGILSQVRRHGGFTEEQHVERQTRVRSFHVDIHSIWAGSRGSVARPVGAQVRHDEHRG